MAKKQLAMAMVFLVLLAGIPAFPAMAATQIVTGDVLKNGGFENLGTDGLPMEWTKDFYSTCTVDAENAAEGKNAVTLEGLNSKVTQTPVTVFPGETYKIQFSARALDDTNADFYGIMTVETLTDAGAEAVYSTAYTENLTGMKAEVWTEFSFSYTAPADIVFAELSLGIVGRGTMSFDGVTMTGKKEEVIRENGELSDVAGAAEGAEETLLNADFSRFTEEGYPENWNAFGGWEKDYVTIMEDGESPSGNNYAKISTTSGGAPHINQQIRDLEEGAQYQMSMWMKVDTSNCGMKLEYYSDYKISPDANVDGDRAFFYLRDEPNIQFPMNEWFRFSWTFYVPVGAKMTVAYFRTYDNQSTIYIDSPSCYKIGGKKAVERTETAGTDWVFYYPDMETGMAYSRVNVDKYPALADGSADFRLMDYENNMVLAEKSGVSFDAVGVANFAFSTALLSEKQKQYTMEIVTRDSLGHVLDTTCQNVYMYDRPKNLGADGLYRFNGEGEVFDPVIGYHVWNLDKDLPELAASGTNVVQIKGGNMQEVMAALDHCDRFGIKVLLPLYGGLKPSAHPDNLENTLSVVQAVNEHPALFGYAVMDEPPTFEKQMAKWLEDSYRIIRDIDPVHPIYLVDCYPKAYFETAKYCDILCIDPYPAGREDSTTWLYELTELAQAAVKGKKPVYHLHQTFTFNGHTPQYNDMRQFLWQAFLQNVKGSGYYCFDGAFVGEEGEILDLYEHPLHETLVSFKEIDYPIAFNRFSRDMYTDFFSGETADIYYNGWVDGSDLYVLVLNKKFKEETRVSLPLVSRNGKVKLDAWHGTVVSGIEGKEGSAVSGNGSLDVTLEPAQAILYKISGAPIDKAALNESAFTDIGDYGWAKDGVDALFWNGVVNAGEGGTYLPAENITRGDFAKFLIETLDLHVFDQDEWREAQNFSDVDAAAPYAEAVKTGKALGILKGTGDGVYNPESPISRQDLMVICARGLRYAKLLASEEVTDSLSAFTDADAIADYAAEDLASMVKAGVVQGNDDGTVNPQGNTTRAEAAVIMQRIAELKK